MIRICFVCLGNICRSPIAESVFRHLVEEAGLDSAFEIDSAGTAGYHSGEAPDPRARAAGVRAGIRVFGRARQFTAADLARFDHVVAMDDANLRDLQELAPGAASLAKIRLLRSFDPAAPHHAPVPDPYYGEDEGFDRVLELCRTACQQFLGELREDMGL